MNALVGIFKSPIISWIIDLDVSWSSFNNRSRSTKTSSSFHLQSTSTIKFNSFNNENFYHYLYSQFVNTYITDGFMNGNSPSKKLSSIIYGMSIITIPMDLQTNKVHQKNLHASFCRYLH
jgi:hypothetical protein